MFERVIFTALLLLNVGIFLVGLYFGLANEFTISTIGGLTATGTASVLLYRAMRRRGYFT